MKCIALNYLNYDFYDTKTGANIKGVNLYVLSPVNANVQTVGNEVSKYSLTLEQFNQFSLGTFSMPAVVDIEISAIPSLRGKAVLKLIDLKFVKKLDLLALCK